MISFNEFIDQLDVIKETIQSDMIFESNDKPLEEPIQFKRHLHCTQSWFIRTSWVNKKRFLLTLLEDVRSVWTISLILKALWNCRTKDAVISAKDFLPWSTFDQVPLDHNRTAAPLKVLVDAMKEDREWFRSQDQETQATIFLELISLSGGPIMWEVMKRAQDIYEISQEKMLQMIYGCSAVPEPLVEKGTGEKTEQYLVNWQAMIKTMRTNMKLEELELTFDDGTKKRLWKVNRVKPETIETVDFLQLLPASLGKQILTYLPKANLGDYARVNKYWAFLVDELKAESAARTKIQLDLEKLKEAISRYEATIEQQTSSDPEAETIESLLTSTATLAPIRKEKFAPYPVKDKKKPVTKPACSMAELEKRLERRGAADGSLFQWCETLMKERLRRRGSVQLKYKNGILPGDFHFPCPLLKQNHCVDVPLQPPLCKELVTKQRHKAEKITSKAFINTNLENPQNVEDWKRYKLWNTDFSSLMPVFKIASHQYNL